MDVKHAKIMLKHINFMSHSNTNIRNRFSNMRTICQSFGKRCTSNVNKDRIRYSRSPNVLSLLKVVWVFLSISVVVLSNTLSLNLRGVFDMRCVLYSWWWFWKALFNTFKRYKHKNLHNLKNRSHLNRSSHESLLRKWLKRCEKY